jgi:uncharacterized protein (DUF58 family)
MNVNGKPRSQRPRSGVGRMARSLVRALVPTERLNMTREGYLYFIVVLLLLVAGMYQQVNLIILVATLAAGPLLMSFLSTRSLLRKLRVVRRAPAYVFSGDPLVVDYTLENSRRWTAALALFIEDSLVAVDRSVSGAVLAPRVFFARVPARDRARIRWQAASPKRGKYRFCDLDLGTRAPFGISERRVTSPLNESILVYPRIGQLTRRWFQLQRQAIENRLGQRHDRSAQQDEYHGLRDYRPGDSPRWIHWRTSARRGELMVKEFEQQNEQDLAILIDPWLPRTKADQRQRDAMEQAISFAATVCLETCRRQGRLLLLGWTGAPPGLRQGQASIKLLHELLEQLAIMRPASEGGPAELFDALPPATFRDSLLIIVSTRPVNLSEEAMRSSRMAGAAARNLLGRAILLNVAQGNLADLIQFADATSSDLLEHRLANAEERLSSPEECRWGTRRSP